MTIIVRTSSPSSTAVRTNSQNQQKVRSQTPIATTSLVSLTDVSAVEIVDNSTIVYNTSTLRYEIKPLPVIFGGTF
jgi:hypothetical protein